MTTSTPPAWHFLEEKYQPVSIDALNLSVSDTLGVRNDSNPDPTYQDCWPSERYPSDGPDCDGVRCERERHTNLPIGAQNEHPECDCTAQVTDSVINAVPEHPSWVCMDCGETRYGKPNAVATWHWGVCGLCLKTKPVTESRDFGNRNYNDPTCTVTAPETTSSADSSHETASFTQGENSADVEVDSCPECGTVTDIGGGHYGEVDKSGHTPDIEYEESVPCGHRVGEDGICGYWSGGNNGQNACTRCGCSPCECDGDTVADKTLATLDPSLDKSSDNCPQNPAKVADRMADRDPAMEWDGPPLSLTSQLRLYGLRVDGVLDRLRLDLDDPAFRDRIVALGAKRLTDGYPTFGDAMYHWTARRRGQEGDEEVADRAVYGTSGPIE